MGLNAEKRKTLDVIIQEKGYTDYDQKMDRFAFLMVH